MKIDLNCDMGESFGRYTLGRDSEMFPLISSANIACGFHAGDPSVMHNTVRMAAEHGVSIGAHPGFPDLAGFGRRNLAMSTDELRDSVIYQISALQGFARVCNVPVQHVKPHGALYNMAAGDTIMAHAIVDALRQLDDNLILFGRAESPLIDVAQTAGLRVAREVFADRAYTEDGRLVPRSQPGSVITDSMTIAERVLKMATERTVASITGVEIELNFDTICVHGDTTGAVEHARQITLVLQQAGVDIVPVGTFL